MFDPSFLSRAYLVGNKVYVSLRAVLTAEHTVTYIHNPFNYMEHVVLEAGWMVRAVNLAMWKGLIR